ncbi:MAG TPA: Fic family protein [Thermoanaerobaculia bacterium]|nr:Fic family protein [Thermoanaerobaculia bacterium]
MKRKRTGTYEVTAVAGERVRAFVPSPLPPSPRIVFDGELQKELERATLALGRLDGVSALLPDRTLFLYSYVRKEAVLSSQIEGTQSSLSDLLLFELDEAPGAPLDDVTEVSNYVAALEHGLLRVREGFPLSSRLLREIHTVLLSRGRGSGKQPGEFRTSQNWIGGSRPGNAAFVPPPHTAIADAMSDLERFLHADDDGLPLLARAGIAHVQFETIHPFLDGNGRVGRLLITLLLCSAGALREPLLYLSLFLKKHRPTYYDLLDRVRRDGDWEAWLSFFLQGVEETATSAVATAQALSALVAEDQARVEQQGRRSGSALRVHAALEARPISSLAALTRTTGLSFPAVASAVELLVSMNIVRELTGKQRNRLFVYEKFLGLLNEER